MLPERLRRGVEIRRERSEGLDNENTDSADHLKNNYVPCILGNEEEHGNVIVWRMPIEISQSRLAGRRKPSYACTLITLKVAEYIYRNGIVLGLNRSGMAESSVKKDLCSENMACEDETSDSCKQTQLKCSPRLISAIVNAILEGNAIHEKQMSKRKLAFRCLFSKEPETFTIPQALDACEKTFKEIEFTSVRGKLLQNMKNFVLGPIKSCPLKDHLQIFMVLIVFERSVLLVYEKETDSISVVDTHSHMYMQPIKGGALIATSSLSEIDCLIRWICENIFPETAVVRNEDQSFEISVVVFNGKLEKNDKPRFIPENTTECCLFPRRTWSQIPRRKSSTKKKRRARGCFTA